METGNITAYTYVYARENWPLASLYVHRTKNRGTGFSWRDRYSTRITNCTRVPRRRTYLRWIRCSLRDTLPARSSNADS